MCQRMFTSIFKHVSLIGIPLGLFLFLKIANAYPYRNKNLIVNASVTIGDFFITKILPDGAIQRRINYHGICAIETIVDWGSTTITLQEITLNKNKKSLQLIYEGDTLTDCTDKKLIDEKNNYCHHNTNNNHNNNNNQLMGNVIKKLEIKNYKLTKPINLTWLNSTKNLLHKCHQIKSTIKNQLLKQHFTVYNNYSIDSENKNKNEMLNEKLGKRNKNYRIRRELFLMPGTQWCGRGSRATKYTDLGGFSKADACCRKHDTACPFYIPAFERRYGLFNFGITTLMHCTCDERFRTCLKMARTSAANLIGKIFFDYTQTKCFTLKPIKLCFKTTWWGKCERYKYKKQAILRRNISYSREKY